MFGWLSAEAARASRWNRSMACASLDEAAELDVLGFVDHAHATAAELLNDAVVRDCLANHGWEAAR